ncbi:MAG: succinate dehydrogenase, hydrophobic membrane anchor protein [Rhizomicrobium sp.]
MSVRTPLGRVEGLGAAHSGTEHFARQRATAVALVPLAIWFGFSAFSLIGSERSDAAAFLAEPLNAVLMALFIIAATMHMALGLQTVIEDYVESEIGKIALLMLNKFFAWAVGAASLFALLKIALLRPIA